MGNKSKKPAKPTHTTVKVPTSAYDLAQELLKEAASGGWHCLGINRNDVPTLGALIEEGLKALKPKPAEVAEAAAS